MPKHTCLSVFDHFVGLALKGLKVWFESGRHFCSITESGCFIKQLSRNKFPNNEFLKSVWTLDSYFGLNDFKYQLPHARFDQISDHKHDIYLYGKLSTKLLTQAANKNTKSWLRKLDGCLSTVSEVTVRKNSKQTLPKCMLKK